MIWILPFIYNPVFTLSWTSQGFYLVPSPFPLLLKIDLSWLNQSPTSFMRARWLFEPTPVYPFTEFILVSVSVLRIYKSKEQLWIYLAVSHSQSFFPWVLVVSIGMCQVWAAHLICHSPSAPSYSDARNKNTNKQQIAAGGQFSSDLVMFSLVTLRAKKTCHLFFF